LAWEAHNSGMPMMRAMWLHYPKDKNVKSLGNQFMWGPNMLIAPVFEKGAASRKVYLPNGEWYDWWTNKKIKGGQEIIREVDLTTIPIYIPAGAIIPFDPIRQYISQKIDEPTTIKVYQGSDGNFTLYEDDGISLDYLEGKATKIKMIWNNVEKVLTVKPDILENQNKDLKERVFRIELLPEGTIKNVTYSGQPIEIRF
jgi:alpha-glucosidase/alpha-D-xyloside xylohydrolase